MDLNKKFGAGFKTKASIEASIENLLNFFGLSEKSIRKSLRVADVP